jgi:hypothetical protein
MKGFGKAGSVIFWGVLCLPAYGYQGQETAAYACDAQQEAIYVASVPDDSPSDAAKRSRIEREANVDPGHMEFIDAGPLIKLSPWNEAGLSYRTGTRELVRRCGDFAITISAGWLNDKWFSYMGSVQYPVLEVRRSGQQVLPPTNLDSCDQTNDLYRDAGCPERFVKVVRIKWSAQKGKAEVELRRD